MITLQETATINVLLHPTISSALHHIKKETYIYDGNALWGSLRRTPTSGSRLQAQDPDPSQWRLMCTSALVNHPGMDGPLRASRLQGLPEN